MREIKPIRRVLLVGQKTLPSVEQKFRSYILFGTLNLRADLPHAIGKTLRIIWWVKKGNKIFEID